MKHKPADEGGNVRSRGCLCMVLYRTPGLCANEKSRALGFVIAGATGAQEQKEPQEP